MSSDDGKTMYVVERPICCSVSTFIVSNYIWAVLALGMCLVGVSGIAVQGGVLIVLPPQAYLAMIVFGGFSLLIIFLGVAGQKWRVELLFLIYVLLMALGLIAQTLAFCFLLLYANDVGTISSFDNAAIDAQKALESHLITFAEEEGSKWRETQNTFDCCGIDFETGIDFAAGVPDDATIAIVETGDRCAIEQANLTDLRANVLSEGPVFDDFGNVEAAKADPNVGFETLFFCKAKISSVVKLYTPAIGGCVGALLFIQLVALVSGSRLYWVPEFLGGWQFDDEELEIVAERKGIALPKQGNGGGARILSTMRAQTNRLSFRIKNAYIPDPEVPRSAGFLNRLSLNRNPTSNGRGAISFQGQGMEDNTDPSQQPYNPHEPSMPPMNSQRSMFGRMSQRLFSRGSNFTAPPPGMDGGHMSGHSQFRPSQPRQPPPGPGAGYNSQRSRMGRVSQRLQSGFTSLGSAFSGGRAPPQPPQPPPGVNSMRSNPRSTFGQRQIPDNAPRASNMSTGSAPPNNFMRQTNGSVPPMSPPGMGFPSAPQGGYQAPPQMSPAPQRVQPPMQRPTPGPIASAPRPNVSSRTPSKKKSKKPSKVSAGGGGGGGGGLLDQIKQGKSLKPAQTIDKSGPRI